MITGEGLLGLSPFTVDILSKNRPTLDELVFGCMCILLLNYVILKFLFKKEYPLWKHIVINLINASFFLINNYVFTYARAIYLPTIWVYGLAFFGMYYYLLFYEKGKPFFKNLNLIPSFLMGLHYTFGIICFEGIWRVLFWAQDLSLMITHHQEVYYGKFLLYSLACALAAWLSWKFIEKRRSGKAAEKQKK